MNIVVVYATAGAGHKKAAQVISDHISRQHGGNVVEIVDVIDQSSALFRIIYLFGYDFLVNHAKWLWSFFFYLTSCIAHRPFIAGHTTLVHYYNTKTFVRYLVDKQPDVIVSTHFLSSDIVALLKRKHVLRSQLITVITDFGVHPFWVIKGTDRYCVAADVTKQILVGKGVDPLSICVTGIPTDPKFAREPDKHKIRASLGIDGRRPVVLVVTGSFGIGPIEEIVRLLHDDYEVLAVCARNNRLHDTLKTAAYSHTHVYGFVDNIDELMAAADVIITKPGGLTISELLCMDLMPLFIATIPGQESMNAAVLVHAGIGSKITRLRDVGLKVSLCIRDAQRIKYAISTFKQANAVSRIYDVIRTCCPGSAR